MIFYFDSKVSRPISLLLFRTQTPFSAQTKPMKLPFQMSYVPAFQNGYNQSNQGKTAHDQWKKANI